jgi:hypothetical protein
MVEVPPPKTSMDYSKAAKSMRYQVPRVLMVSILHTWVLTIFDAEFLIDETFVGKLC